MFGNTIFGFIGKGGGAPPPVNDSWLLGGNSNGALQSFGTNDNYSIPIVTNSNNVGIITNTGYFGFGTVTPSATIHSVGVDSTSSNYAMKVASSSSDILSIRNDNSVFIYGLSGIYLDNSQRIYQKNSIGVYEAFLLGRYNDNRTVMRYGSGGFTLSNNSSDALYVNNSKQFGFGYAYGSPLLSAFNFVVSTTDADGIRISNTSASNGSGYGVLISGGTSGFGISNWANSTILENQNSSSLVLGSLNSNIIFQTGARNSNMILDVNGNFGVGTLSPTARIKSVGVDSTSSNYSFISASSSQDIFSVRNDNSVFINGSMTTSINTVPKTSNYNMTDSDNTILCGDGTFSVFLLSAIGRTGRNIYIKKKAGSIGNVTVVPNGSETIDGSASEVLNPTDSLFIKSDGTNWIIQ